MGKFTGLSPIFDGKNNGFRLRFSLKPIQWMLRWWWFSELFLFKPMGTCHVRFSTRGSRTYGTCLSHRIWEKLLEKPRAEYRQVNQFSVVSHHFHDSNDRIFAKILLKATTKNWFGLSWNFQSCKGLNFRFPTSMERRIVVPIIFIYVLETFGKRTIIPIIFTYFQSVSIMFQWFSPV